jgi:four helix bundle protein
MHYQDIAAWQKGMDLVDAVYEAVGRFPKSEMFLLSQQMRSAALSIPSNIAEGNGRWSTRDYRHFVVQARGSAYELETHILVAQRRKFFTREQATVLLSLTKEVCRLINGLIRHLDGDPFDDAR